MHMKKRKAVGGDSCGAFQPAAPGAKQRCPSRHVDPASELAAMRRKGPAMQAIRILGKVPKESKGTSKTEQLSAQLCVKPVQQAN